MPVSAVANICDTLLRGGRRTLVPALARRGRRPDLRTRALARSVERAALLAELRPKVLGALDAGLAGASWIELVALASIRDDRYLLTLAAGLAGRQLVGVVTTSAGSSARTLSSRGPARERGP